jgi:hypothetical protein
VGSRRVRRAEQSAADTYRRAQKVGFKVWYWVDQVSRSGKKVVVAKGNLGVGVDESRLKKGRTKKNNWYWGWWDVVVLEID